MRPPKPHLLCHSPFNALTQSGCPVGVLSHVAGLLKEGRFIWHPQIMAYRELLLYSPTHRLAIVRMWWERGAYPDLILKEQSTGPARAAPPHRGTLHQLGQKQEVGAGNPEPWERD